MNTAEYQPHHQNQQHQQQQYHQQHTDDAPSIKVRVNICLPLISETSRENRKATHKFSQYYVYKRLIVLGHPQEQLFRFKGRVKEVFKRVYREEPEIHVLKFRDSNNYDLYNEYLLKDMIALEKECEFNALCRRRDDVEYFEEFIEVSPVDRQKQVFDV